MTAHRFWFSACLLLLSACAGAPPSGGPPSPESPPGEVLKPAVDSTEAQQLDVQAANAIERAGTALAAVDAESLSNQNRRRLDIARNLLSQARQALADDDAGKAAQLADKAAVMAEDLSGI